MALRTILHSTVLDMFFLWRYPYENTDKSSTLGYAL